MFLFTLKLRTEYNVHATVHSISHEMNRWLWWEWSPGIMVPLLQWLDCTALKKKKKSLFWIGNLRNTMIIYHTGWLVGGCCCFGLGLFCSFGFCLFGVFFGVFVGFARINFKVRHTMRVKLMFLLSSLHFIPSWKHEYELWTPWLATFSWREHRSLR